MTSAKPLTVLLNGGGNRFCSFAGVLRGLEEKCLKIGKMIGASTGAIVAALAAAGRSYDEIVQILVDMDTDSFRERERNGLSRAMGIYSGRILQEWLDSLFGDLTFGDDLAFPLQIVATDIRHYRPVVFSREFFPQMRIATACRASASLPFVFSPCPLSFRGRDYLLVDGFLMAGLIEMGIARSRSERLLTFRVVSKRTLNHPGVEPGDWKGYWREILAFYLHSQEKEFIKGGQWRDNILIHCGDISPAQFTLSRAQRQWLIEEGYLQTMKYLEYKWGL